MKAVVSLFCFSMLLVGCSSATKQPNYYLFASTNSIHEASFEKPLTQRKAILLKPVILADFLNQPHIVFNHKPNQLHQAVNHLWAEPLDKSIALVIAQTINEKSDYYTAELLPELRSDSGDYRLQLRVDQFYPTYEQTAVLYGRYWLYNKQGDKLIVSRNFAFDTPLEQDGYEHAIAKMQGLLAELALSLLKEIP